MRLADINDFSKWRKEASRQGIPITFIPLRFNQWQALGQDDRGAWLAPTYEEVNSKPRKK